MVWLNNLAILSNTIEQGTGNRVQGTGGAGE